MKHQTFSLFTLFAALLCATSTWATDYNVKNDSELRAAIQNNGANITVTADINLSNSTLSIESGKTVTINLNGHTLDRKLTKRGEGGGQVITVRSSATLNLSNGTLKGGWGGAGGALVNEGGTVTLTDVTITNNVADDRGGGICNREGGTLTMTGGAVTNNTSYDKTDPAGGGGLFNAKGATATLTGVTITGNEAKLWSGGGICNYGTLKLDGCTIQNNTARFTGGGIWTENQNKNDFKMQGANIITDNIAGGVPGNLYLRARNVITLTGSIAGSQIGVTLERVPETFTKGYDTYHHGVDPHTFFTCDRPEFNTIDSYEEVMLKKAELPEGTVPYIECSWDSENKKVVTTMQVLNTAQYTKLTPSEDVVELGTEDSEQHEYYVVSDEEVNISTIYIKGPNVHIILCDNDKLHVENEIDVWDGHTVYFHAQSAGSDMGKLTAAGIGGNMSGESGGNIVIHGGYFDLQGTYNCAAIGGKYNTGSNITIFDGQIKATGGDGAAGIGGGYACENYGNIIIYDGKIEATGSAGIGGGPWCLNGNLTIWGGAITARGQYEAAGIGCHQDAYDYGAGTININGGYIRAYGDDYGAGIGGGDGVRGGTLNVNGGHVEAYGGTDAAGIGGGEGGNGGIVNITGGYVYAEGGWEYGAGIGGGQDGEGASVTITGGTVIAKAGLNETGCRAIGPGEGSDNYGSLTLGDNLMVSSERLANAAERKNMCWYRTQARVELCTHQDATYTVSGTTAADTHTKHCQYCTTAFTPEPHDFAGGTTCLVCGVEATVCDVRFYLPKEQGGSTYDGETYSSQTSQMVPGSTFNMPSCSTTVPGLEFKGWEVSSVTSDPYTSSYTSTDGGTILDAGDEYTITGNVSFIARYQTLDISLADDADNSLTLLQYSGMTAHSVTLTGRTLKKNGSWNTLCLPFDLATLTGTPLAGCTLMELDVDGTYDTDKQTGFDNGTLYLYFKDATSIKAGKAYLIMWSSGTDITNPTFSNVTINNVLYGVRSQDKTVAFAGIFSPKAIAGEDKSILYLGVDNKLYYPNAAMSINACRGYFRLKGITAGDVTSTRLLFDGDEATTSLSEELRVKSEDGLLSEGEKFATATGWYTLDGFKLDKKPTTKGVYIYNGKKLVIK